jgi:hypothetical protein
MLAYYEICDIGEQKENNLIIAYSIFKWYNISFSPPLSLSSPFSLSLSHTHTHTHTFPLLEESKSAYTSPKSGVHLQYSWNCCWMKQDRSNWHVKFE